MIGCLQTHVRKQPIIALYFESENELKFYNLEAWVVNPLVLQTIFEEFYLIWAWQPFLSCDREHKVNLHCLIEWMPDMEFEFNWP